MINYQLLIQTALKQSVLALFRDHQCLHEQSMVLDHRSDNTYVHDIQAMISKQKIAYTDIHELYLVHGPGFFTGVRAGVIITKAWYQLFGPRVQLVCSFDYLSACLKRPSLPFGIVIAASGKEGYYKQYDEHQDSSPRIMAYQDIADLSSTIPVFSDHPGFCETWGFNYVQPLALLPLPSTSAPSLNEIYPAYIRREDELFR